MTSKDNNIISNKKAVVACDLFLPLRFYHLPEWLQERLNIAFPNVRIIPVNTSDSPLTNEDATVYWGNRITLEIIKTMPKLEWIHFGSVGVNRANTEEVYKRDILITSSKGLVVSAMVTSAIAFMTSLARGIHYNQKLRSEKNMSRESFDYYYDQIHELAGERCLIVGFGDVGNKLAKVCKALEMNVAAIGRTIKKHDSVDEIFSMEKIISAVMNADYIVNLLPLNHETEQVFTKKIFSKMKSSAFFINIGRGETVDEDALIEALKNKKIAGAGLDVFAQEPLKDSSPLWDLDNVILSPHVAGLSKAYWERQANLFTHNLKCYLDNDCDSMHNITDIKPNSVT